METRLPAELSGHVTEQLLKALARRCAVLGVDTVPGRGGPDAPMLRADGVALACFMAGADDKWAHRLAVLSNLSPEICRLALAGLRAERPGATRAGRSCPACGSEKIDTVPLGRRGERGARRVSCRDCGTTHYRILRSARAG